MKTIFMTRAGRELFLQQALEGTGFEDTHNRIAGAAVSVGILDRVESLLELSLE